METWSALHQRKLPLKQVTKEGGPRSFLISSRSRTPTRGQRRRGGRGARQRGRGGRPRRPGGAMRGSGRGSSGRDGVARPRQRRPARGLAAARTADALPPAAAAASLPSSPRQAQHAGNAVAMAARSG